MRAGSGKRSARSAKAAVAAATALLALGALGGPAQAAPPQTIAGFGSGAGEVLGPDTVDVHDDQGDLYVGDRNWRVGKFDAAGNFLLAWGFRVRDGLTAELQSCGPEASPTATARCFGVNSSSETGAGNILPNSVAVDQASGDVYVSDSGARRRVTKFSPQGEFLFMVGKGVNPDGTSAEEMNICTAADLGEGDQCGAGEVGSGPNEFESPRPVAVHSGQVWVGDVDRLASFDASGAPGPEVELPGCGAVSSLAIDSAGDYYLKCGSLPGIRKHEALTGNLLAVIEEGHDPRTVTLDAEDNIYIGHCVTSSATCQDEPYRFVKYSPALEQSSQFGAGQVIGTPGGSQGNNSIAVDDDSKTLYSASSRSGDNSAVQAFAIPEPGPLPGDERAEDLTPTTATLAASLNPEGNETTYRFEYLSEEDYEGQGNSFEGPATVRVPEPPDPPETLPATGFDSEEVQAPLTGLIPATTYRFRLVATNHCDPEEPAEECTVSGEEVTFATLPAVGIEAQWATGVAARSATLRAEIDPLGADAVWWVEYGKGEAFDRESEEFLLGAGAGPTAVAVGLSGLDPATAYGYRFAARAVRDEVTYEVRGEPRGLTTQLGELGFDLADERAWEMTSPAEKHGARLRSPAEGHVQAAVDGDALAYLSRGSVEADPPGSRAPEDTTALARRSGPGEWASRDITPPNAGPVPLAIGLGLEYKLFSPDLTRALLEPRGTGPLAPEASERTPYLRHNGEPPVYVPLVVGCPPPEEPCPPAVEEAANVPPGTVFGTDPERPPSYPLGAVRIAGATADLGHVVLGSTVPLAPEAAAGALYVWEAGELTPASVLPGGGGAVGAGLGSGAGSVANAISADGERVFFRSGPGLYVRDLARGETVRLDAVQGGFGTGAADPVFQGADPQGAVAFFTDSRNLTPEAGEDGRDLYRCELAIQAGELACELSDVSGEAAEAIAPGQSAEVQGLLAGIAEDATSAYFVARGVLDEAPNSHGESAVGGEPNLYGWSEAGGTRFVARLAEGDEHDWGELPTGCCFAAQKSAAASPSGRYLAFMSELPLTGYDNRDAVSGERAQEVFRYDATAEELLCASCDPSGARPRGLVGFEEGEGLPPAYDPQALWRGRALAAVLPDATRTSRLGASLHRPRSIHDNGRLFFNAADSLVGADSNGEWDVYEHEPHGLGDCGPGSGGAATAQSAGGCVSLISSGAGEGEAAFIDASLGGDDVFFWTQAQLAVTDKDEVTDIYDARVGGTEATLEPVSECLGEACQPAAFAPDAPTPASSAFLGPGNPPPASASRCGRRARQAKKASNRAKRMRRAARRVKSPAKARRMRRGSRRLARQAKKRSAAAKRCRRRQRSDR